MAITYYPDSLVKKFKSPIEQLQKHNQLLSVTGHADITSGFTYAFNPGADCEIREVQLAFSTSTSKSYAISKSLGRGVVAGVNDQLWFQVDGAAAQSIIIPAGFYNGTQFAAALKAQLDANGVFLTAGYAPFTVSYTASTGVFSVAPAAGSIAYFENLNPTTTLISTSASAPAVTAGLRSRSTAGPLIGFTVNKSAAASLTSDAPVYGLNVVNDLVAATGTDQHVVSTDVFALDIDQGLQLSAGSAAMTLDYKIVYQLQ